MDTLPALLLIGTLLILLLVLIDGALEVIRKSDPKKRAARIAELQSKFVTLNITEEEYDEWQELKSDTTQ